MLKKNMRPDFNPNDISIKGSLFGMPYTIEDAQLLIIPVPWEVTASYKAGAANAPQAILEASLQVDLGQHDIHKAWKLGMTMLPVSEDWKKKNRIIREQAQKYIGYLENDEREKINDAHIVEGINKACIELNEWLKELATDLLNRGKMLAVLGGDHSTSLGLIQALERQYNQFGILQMDAHADLRKAYEDFEFSHASIMFNALKSQKINKLVQVGVRDFCEEEVNFINAADSRVITFYDQQMKDEMFKGKHWDTICEEIIRELPANVYLSFDIDVLNPWLCPHTGTPVPGGLDFDQSLFLIKKLVLSGRKIIGLDLCEVAPDPTRHTEWDANVGARVLYRLANLMAVSQGKLQWA